MFFTPMHACLCVQKRTHDDHEDTLAFTYHALQIVRGGKLSQYAKLNCNSLENYCG